MTDRAGVPGPSAKNMSTAIVGAILLVGLLMPGCEPAAARELVTDGVGYPRITTYGGFRSWGFPAIVDNKVDSTLVKRLARFQQVTIDLAAATARPDIAATVRYYNPNAKVIGYLLVGHWWLPDSFVLKPSSEGFNDHWHRTLQATDCFKRPPAPQGYEVESRNRACMDSLGKLIARSAHAANLDGVFLDYCADDIWWVHPSYGGRTGDSLRRVNYSGLIKRIRDAAEKPFLVYGNGCHTLDIDGKMIEGYPDHLPASKFEDAIKLKPGDWLKSETQDKTDHRHGRFALGSALLTGAWVNWTSGNGGRSAELHDANYWLPEYSIGPDWKVDETGQHTGWMGHPRAPAVRLASGLWLRHFENGKRESVVIVNRYNQPKTHTMEYGSWQRVGVAEVGTTFTVGGLDAIILRRIE